MLADEPTKEVVAVEQIKEVPAVEDPAKEVPAKEEAALTSFKGIGIDNLWQLSYGSDHPQARNLIQVLRDAAMQHVRRLSDAAQVA